MMKKVIIFMFLIALTVVGTAQNKWNGFFKPVENTLVSKASGTNVWKPRPAVHVTAMEIGYDKATKTWNTYSFQSAGVGISYQHFIQSNGQSVTNYGFTGLMLFNGTPGTVLISPAVTVELLQIFNFGVKYDTGMKKVSGLLGISYSFN